ncbi:BMC domain-containing protein, partial [Frisingicoccus sp.]
MIETVGFLELNSIAKGVEAADAILKAAQVELAFAKPV